jgi:hypothetical protein
MTDPDYKALCAELVENLERYQCWYIEDNGYGIDELEALLRRARAALAQPVAPTSEELDELFASVDEGAAELNWRTYARAVLARWGQP